MRPGLGSAQQARESHSYATGTSTTKYHKVFDIFSFFVYFFLIMVAVALDLEFWILEFEIEGVKSIHINSFINM